MQAERTNQSLAIGGQRTTGQDVRSQNGKVEFQLKLQKYKNSNFNFNKVVSLY